MTESESTGTSRSTAIFGMILTFVGGYFTGAFTSGRGPEGLLEEATKAERVAVPIELSPALGPSDALVTVVEFADFQCGYCAHSVQLQKRLLAEFPGNVRWAFKHFPLDMHREAMGAARAAMAAQAQGKFWELHDRLFANQRRIAAPYFTELARELGLEMATFERAMQGDTLEKIVRLDMEVGRRLGVQGTPSFFINGRRVAGALPYSDLQKIVRQELVYASSLLRRGVPRDQLYEELTRAKGTGPGTSSAPTATSTREAQEGQIYKVYPGDSPAQGPATAPLTVIVFGDFQCPKSADVMQVLQQLRGELGERLRIVFKHFPLRAHAHAQLAAEASLAAHAQGRFWRFQEQLYSAARTTKDLSLPLLLRVGAVTGLKMDRFKDALDQHLFAGAVRRDAAEAAQLGLPGTPALFLNGRHVRGTRPLDELRRLADEALKRAGQALQQGTRPEELYEALVRSGVPAAG